ncbi:HK97 family phage prohead protease [Stappia sp. TSB10P1A]|uniref:HK97 family phage prohead protease n=1 Tax=Stappia sp. TSB10P1A TaxID=2003585 RepID=UPI001643AFA9|nr:HK97 family phage prohead protease [Stappia sp. TSB10P1A]
METETKGLKVKDVDDAGKGLARLATLSAIDHDGDTYAKGAFAWKEQWVPIIPAHDRKAPPMGKARLYEAGDEALAELHLNLKTASGRDWHENLKFDLVTGTPVQEWSYGYDVLDKSDELRGGDPVRVLKKLDVHEISTVIRGAGKGSGTLAMKSHSAFSEQLDHLIAALDDAIGRAGDVKALRAADGRPLSPARLAQLADLKSRLDTLIGTGEADEEAARKAHSDLERLAADLITADARRRIRR